MADFGTELDVFRTETREWLEANCPASCPGLVPGLLLLVLIGQASLARV